MSSSLDPAILALVEMSPVEDLLPGLLRPLLPGVKVETLIDSQQAFPAVLIRSTGSLGDWDGDPRFLDAAQVSIGTFCVGVNADEDANLLAEAIRVVLRDSVNVVVPGRGHMTKVRMLTRPKRVTDWATATGPVQYADLPEGVCRWETTYAIEIRKPAVIDLSHP